MPRRKEIKLPERGEDYVEGQDYIGGRDASCLSLLATVEIHPLPPNYDRKWQLELLKTIQHPEARKIGRAILGLRTTKEAKKAAVGIMKWARGRPEKPKPKPNRRSRPIWTVI